MTTADDLRGQQGDRSARVGSADQPQRARGGDEAVLTLAEERLVVGTRRVPVGRVRVRREVVHDEVTVTVPVRREVLHVERLDDAGTDQAGPDGTGLDDAQDLEWVLHEERPVVATEVVPVERVRVVVTRTTQEQEVSAVLRREEAELDDPDGVVGGV